jgi:lipopolysaccharide export system protein LptA
MSSFIDFARGDERFDYDNESSASNVESYFKSADYYLAHSDKSNFHLFSDELIHNHSPEQLIMSKPNGVLFSETGEPTYYSGASGYYNVEERKLYLKRNVIIRSVDALINSSSMNYDDESKVVEAEGDVFSKTQNYDRLYDVVVRSSKLVFNTKRDILKYQGAVNGQIKRTRKYEVPVSFNSDALTFFVKDRKASLNGNVSIKKQGIKAMSHRGEIFLENYNKKLKYFALYDDVIVEEKVHPRGMKPFERKAYSEKLEGYTSESKIVLLGFPKVYQKNDILKGNVIILRENNETIEVDDANTNFKLR